MKRIKQKRTIEDVEREIERLKREQEEARKRQKDSAEQNKTKEDDHTHETKEDDQPYDEKSAWEVLVVSPALAAQITRKDAKAKYLRLAQLYHEDHGGTKEATQRLNRAWEIICAIRGWPR